jgi:protein SCO1
MRKRGDYAFPRSPRLRVWLVDIRIMLRLFALLLVLSAAWPALAQDDAKSETKDAKLYHAYPDGGLAVGDFNLKERGGKYLRARDLLGKVWVVQVFYPGCNLCSRNTPTMQKLQEHYRGKADVRFLSIPLRFGDIDTVTNFAKSHDADPEQWLFLSGSKDELHHVVSLGFFSMNFPKEYPDAGDVVAHETKLKLVDHNGVIVGWVDGTEPGAFEAIKEQLDRLRSQRRLEERIPIRGADLPWLNAMLNGSCTILLLLGWTLIRMRFATLHKLVMLLALAVSMVFLSSYLFYHFVVMEMEPMRFKGEGAARYAYFGILLSHTILAIVVAPMAIYITVQGLRNALAPHVKLARWTLPIWLYVSVTGVVVYWMLYRIEW